MKLRKCITCNQYTFKETCPKCNKKTVIPVPPKFSPQDKYGKYRRKLIGE
jgi:H/ACA ribonucleoprotein complex subunit 3